MTITVLKHHILSLRNRVCPRTSYATSGSSASSIYALLLDRSCTAGQDINDLFQSIKSAGEFEQLVTTSSITDLVESVNGNVVLVYGVADHTVAKAISSMFYQRRTKLTIFISRSGPGSTSQHQLFDDGMFTLYEQELDGFSLLACFNYKGRTVQLAGSAGPLGAQSCSSSSTLGFNKQPSVQSKEQFRFLWSSPSQTGTGKDRVLQRLASKKKHSTDIQCTTSQWDSTISEALRQGNDDYQIYSMVRKFVLGMDLEQTLKQSIEKAAHSGYGNEGHKDVGIGMSVTNVASGGGDEDDNGRANFMVSRTLDSVPPTMRSAGMTHIRTYLDYGCAEGAITAVLGRELGLAPSCIIGADVRVIPSDGFTFMPLAAENPNSPPPVGSILPKIKNGSIDLITAAMVFHHVTHITSVLLELRRVISPHGALVIREVRVVNVMQISIYVYYHFCRHLLQHSHIPFL